MFKLSRIEIIRESMARVIGLLAKRSIPVYQRGMKAYVEYHKLTGAIVCVNLPYLPDNASEELIAAIQGFLDHEVGHILFSDPAVIGKANESGSFVRNLHNMIEDVFVERRMSESFPGSHANLESLRNFFFDQLVLPSIHDALRAGRTDVANLNIMMLCMRAWGGQVKAKMVLRDPLIAPIAEKLSSELPRVLFDRLPLLKSSRECLDLALAVDEARRAAPPPPPAERPKKAAPPPPDADDADEDPGYEPESEAGTGGESGADPDAGPSADEAEAGPEGDDDSGDDEAEADEAGEGDSPPADESGPRREEAPDLAATVLGGEGDDASDEEGEGASRGDSEGSTSGGSGPEPEPAHEPTDAERAIEGAEDFDDAVAKAISEKSREELVSAPYKIFSTDWDVEEVAPKGRVADTEVTAIEDMVRPMVGVMAQKLRMALAAKSKVGWVGGRRSGSIDPSALYRAAIGDDRVFRRRVETKAASSRVSLLIDCSGSMSGSRIKTAALAAFAFARTLESLKIEYEILGFTARHNSELDAAMRKDGLDKSGAFSGPYGRGYALYTPIFKSFGERLTMDVKRRLVALSQSPNWLCENVDGESVMLAARRLVRGSRCDRHILMVLSDGEPACPPGRGLSTHLKDVVQKLSAGMDVVGIGIETTSVRRYYPQSVVLRDVSELPRTVVAELSKLLLKPL